ncbi:hypothetical protein FSP39_000320 [Pinctada imbricata]|uniref:Uncharacterized protein n=1 Tax=Pinctada imbricata TaxID=66713 RepID=A0AA88YFY5_PINIB|nr:hypothetical protein FSP39_000320 [Pinctada imbricata]
MTSPQVVSQPQHANPPSMMGFTSPYPVSIQKVQVCGPPLLCSDIKSESRIRSPTVSSTQEDIQRRQQDQKSQRLSKDSDVQIIDLATEMDLVLCRLREALQNRRKYLLDRETGKRALAMKKARSNSTQSQIDVKSVLQINHFMPHSPKKEVKEEKTDFVIEIQ